MRAIILVPLAVMLASLSTGQRIQTIEVGNSRYFISSASPYSPTLNWFLAYEYCRNIGMELLALEQSEETETLNNFLRENNYVNTDYWTSGNQLGSAMWIWMSTGQPFNSTFNYWAAGGPPLTKSQQSCMSIQNAIWSPQNCMDSKSFICEQTRCFYYNYVTTNRVSSQGNSSIVPGVTRVRRPIRLPTRTTTRPSQANTQREQHNEQQHSPINATMSTTQVPKIQVQSDRSTTPSTISSGRTPSLLKQMTSPPPSQSSKIISTTEQVKIMPTPQVKVMPTTSPQQIKVMPSQSPDQVKVMPVKVMPVKIMPAVRPPINDPSINIQNNEIVPGEADLFLHLLLPPTQDFVPEETTTEAVTEDVTEINIMEVLSRKETFSWALDDST